MKNIIQRIVLVTIIGTALIACEKEDVNFNEPNTSPSSSETIKQKNTNNKSVYPIIIEEDLSELSNFSDVIEELEEDEYIHSTIVNGVQHNEIRLNLDGDNIPDDPNDPAITFGCPFPDSNGACLASIAFWHQYNLDNCEGSSTGYSNGTLWVHGWGCDEVA